jgi:hypothetical protein
MRAFGSDVNRKGFWPFSGPSIVCRPNLRNSGNNAQAFLWASTDRPLLPIFDFSIEFKSSTPPWSTGEKDDIEGDLVRGENFSGGRLMRNYPENRGDYQHISY